MAMFMQDNLMSLEATRDSLPKQRQSGSQSTAKAECIFNPKSPDHSWCTGNWLVEKLIPNSSEVDVVTIVGPLAHGKSHSLNTRVFRDAHVIKKLSMSGVSEPLLFDVQRDADGQGTMGVWAAYQNYDKFLVFDTQGFHEKPLVEVAQRDPTAICAVRNAVKLMAMSDVVVFHTSTPRIDPNETFRFLQEASVVMQERLAPAIQRKNKPALIVFHQVLQEHPLDYHKFRSLLGESVCSTFGDVQYLPVVRTTEEDFGALNAAITESGSRKSTHESIVAAFDTLFLPEMERFPVDIIDTKAIVPLELFACPYICLACGKRCCLLQHCADKMPHLGDRENGEKCRVFVETLKNRAFYCRKCKVEALVTGYSPDDYGVVKLFKYYTQGANMINCPNCKTIYSGDQGAWPPNDDCNSVETRVSHVWQIPGQVAEATSAVTPAVFYSRALLDPLVDATDSFVSIFKPKAQTVQKLVLDSVRPDYWLPDDQATQCKICSTPFPDPGLKHHCRQCGQIFCESCSSHLQPVAERGWGETPVRVCNNCYGKKFEISEDGNTVEANVKGRWFFEQVGRAFSAVESVGGYVGSTIINQTNPDYWQKETDEGAHLCNCCHQPFEKSVPGAMQDSTSGMSASTIATVGDKRRHHCRQCGKFICGSCSPFRMAVPERGWGELRVRVCNNCFTSKSSNQTSSSSNNALASSQ